ncbi:hypothetical protein AAVH_40565, partial [Aphelenchoides avenae]
MLAGFDRRMNRLEDTFVSIQLRTATPILDNIASSVDDAKQTLNRTLSNAKQTLSSWNPLDWMTAWYYYAILVILFSGVIAAITGCWYAAPYVLACFNGLREAIRVRRQAQKFRRQRRRPRTHNTEMNQMIAAVHAEEPFPQPKADVKLYEFCPSFALMTVATRHHQREAGVPPSIVARIGRSETIIILDTGSYSSTSKKELQYMTAMTPFSKTMTNSLFISLPSGHHVAASEQYDVQLNVEGKNLPFSLLVPDADTTMPNTIIFGCDGISALNSALALHIAAY